MYLLKITRYKEFEDATLGNFELLKDGFKVYAGYTLEPAGPDTTTPNQDKRIPKGKYSAIWQSSSQTGASIVGQLPLVFNEEVPKSRLIRIHVGNYPKDTLGCILLGSTTNGTAFVGQSKVTLTKFCQEVFPNDFEIEIFNDFPEVDSVNQ